MKFLEKVGLVLFSNIVLILSIVFIFLMFNWIDFSIITKIHEWFNGLSNIPFYVSIIVAVLLILLAIKCIFFSGNDSKDSKKDGISVEGPNGRLIITKETLENIVSSVVKGFEGARETSTRIAIDSENGVFIFITLNVLPDVVIKELINNIQEKVKASIKKASDLDVKEVNVKVKSIYDKVEKTEKTDKKIEE